jgi:hypothetical protein
MIERVIAQYTIRRWFWCRVTAVVSLWLKINSLVCLWVKLMIALVNNIISEKKTPTPFRDARDFLRISERDEKCIAANSKYFSIITCLMSCWENLECCFIFIGREKREWRRKVGSVECVNIIFLNPWGVELNVENFVILDKLNTFSHIICS